MNKCCYFDLQSYNNYGFNYIIKNEVEGSLQKELHFKRAITVTEIF